MVTTVPVKKLELGEISPRQLNSGGSQSPIMEYSRIPLISITGADCYILLCCLCQGIYILMVARGPMLMHRAMNI